MTSTVHICACFPPRRDDHKINDLLSFYFPSFVLFLALFLVFAIVLNMETFDSVLHVFRGIGKQEVFRGFAIYLPASPSCACVFLANKCCPDSQRKEVAASPFSVIVNSLSRVA